MGVLRPDLLIRCIIPVVMAGIIAVRMSGATDPIDLRSRGECAHLW